MQKKSITNNRFLIPCAFLIIILIPCSAWCGKFRAKSDQVLVIYNEDWTADEEGSDHGQDSKEIAEYYVRMHTDPKTGTRPYILGLRCRHGKNHLNKWKIEEPSTDNKNGVIFKGKGKPPKDIEWARDSRKVEISVSDGSADWGTVQIRCKSKDTGEERLVFHDGKDAGVPSVHISGLARDWKSQRIYPAAEEGGGRTFRFDASQIFAGQVTVFFSVKDRDGTVLKNLEIEYYDIADFEFSQAGADKIPDDKMLEEDVLIPIRHFLESPVNVLPDGTLLKDHIVYIVLVHGMPYSASGVFGIEHGSAPNKRDHGTLASLEQRVQTLYYGWDTVFSPPVTSVYMAGGPDSRKGVASHIITTAMRNPLSGNRWNPYSHPDTYSYLGKDKDNPPVHYAIPPLSEKRKYKLPPYFHAYAVTRIDGGTVEEAKRIIDYSLYASRYLRPEMDCSVRKKLKMENNNNIDDLADRLKMAERENLWGAEELKKLGFRVISSYENQGVPFMVMSRGLTEGKCDDKDPKWEKTGFYPGGIGRGVVSNNGWNDRKTAPIWQYLKKGVTVSACGAPAYDGGPHITNATFWDNRILLKYLFRGKDLGEALLLSSYYVNWSTSLVGDPLLHPDLSETMIDKTPPAVAPQDISVTVAYGSDGYTATIQATIGYSYENPEVALLRVDCLDTKRQEVTGTTDLFSRRPSVHIKSLEADMDYTCEATFFDPYDNRTTVQQLQFRVEKTASGKKLFQDLQDIMKGYE